KGPHEITYVTGSILAYYGNGVLDGCDELTKRCYKAVLFHADVGFELKVGQQELKKSIMAVPADGYLMIEAVIFDVKAGKYVFNGTQELHPGPNNHSEWRMSWENGCFNLTVEWNKGPKCFDSFMEEIDLSFILDYPMPPGIQEDDYDSEGDILILEELLRTNSLSLSENESFHFDIPSFSHPLAKPPDGNT
nr:arginine--tRNA ligase, chloroplastic/mitochondrial [Tanacetum cinerariifolium]